MGPKYEPAERRDARLTGHAVVDARQDKIGKVTDVIFDDRGAPQWVVVRTGVLSGEHFMPLGESYLDHNDRLVVPLDKDTIKRAPRARRDHVLTLATRRGLRDYYGVVV
jgi:hypothetical protein